MTLSLIKSVFGTDPVNERIQIKTPPSWIWYNIIKCTWRCLLLNSHFWGQSRKASNAYFSSNLFVFPQTDDMSIHFCVRHDSCSHARTPCCFLEGKLVDFTVRKVVHFFSVFNRMAHACIYFI